MEEKQSKKRRIFKKLKNKYRLVILNDSTFEERFSYRLSPLNIFISTLIGMLLIISLVVVIIVFTPLRESIPGYTDVNLRRDLTAMVLKADSLERIIELNNQYLNNVNMILKGEDPGDLIDTTINDDLTASPNSIASIRKSKEDSLLRDYVQREDSYSLNLSEDSPSDISKLLFFTPLKGSITNQFNAKDKHYGIDVVAKKNEAVKAILNGTVIFAEWTVETGYVIQIQHDYNLNSIYKHNSVLLKKVGDVVKAGEAIAIVGNSGELTTGPHLHFELWKNGVAQDPSQYINF
jgi:murein DD-endopeptidase MepM/ murein hydrolase activator NlpD